MKNALDFFRGRNFNPMREWDSLQRDINRLFEDFPRSAERWDALESRFSPSCDVSETDKEFLITADLPGVKKEDVKVEVMNGMLTISGERKQEKEERTKTHYISERSQGSYYRSFALPSDVESDKISASFDDGELRITVPKGKAAGRRLVKIGSEAGKGRTEKLPESAEAEKLKAV